MHYLLWTALFFPLVGFLSLLGMSKQPRRLIETIGPNTILASFILFSILAYKGAFQEATLFTWIPLKALYTPFAVTLDPLSSLMTLIITGIGYLIHVYSRGYMEHDRDIARYFAVMNFFIFSMLLLVLASNLLLFFIGWEGVGLASYLLIGFWYHKPSAEQAAKKAFVVNRIGDFGLLLGILLTFALFGTSDIQTISKAATTQATPIITLVTLLYFWGACGKSAQMPLHSWLPDAMEGPTPVSALIHAATMVTAGVYLVVRLHEVFTLSPDTLMIVGSIGAITSLFAALSATSQSDIKRVLAYSTLSQLGLMFMACSAGAYFAAMFHLTMHAFVKALLFLSAGNVIHMLHGKTELSDMGGLSRIFKKTNYLFLTGVLSMAAIPPLAIFFSKDLILEEVKGLHILYYMGLSVSWLTAYYLMRAYSLSFCGEPIETDAKEAPRRMLMPLFPLAILSVVGGALGPILLSSLAPLIKGDMLHIGVEALIATGIAATGALTGLVYNKKALLFFYNAFYINELYDYLVVRPLNFLSCLISRLIEPLIFDKSLKIVSSGSFHIAKGLQLIQNGQIRSYISWLIAGAGAITLYLVLGGL